MRPELHNVRLLGSARTSQRRRTCQLEKSDESSPQRCNRICRIGSAEAIDWKERDRAGNLCRPPTHQHAISKHTASSDLMFPAVRRNKDKQQIPVRPRQFLQRHMKPLAEQLGIDSALITFQVLRRTFGTTMQKHGTMKDVQAHLRHASITTTGNIYVQEIPAREILGGDGSEGPQELQASDSTVSNCAQVANQRRCKSLRRLAPEVGLEPTTLRLTAVG
jgi:Phage integrase family